MLKEIGLENFFRYLAPGSVGILFYAYLSSYGENGHLIFFGFPLSQVQFQGAAALIYVGGILFFAAVFGYIFSLVYHFIINLPVIEYVLHQDHRDFFISTTACDSLKLEYFGEHGYREAGDQSQKIAESLSRKGAAMLFDSAFYRLRAEKDKSIDENRFESLFHIWH